MIDFLDHGTMIGISKELREMNKRQQQESIDLAVIHEIERQIFESNCPALIMNGEHDDIGEAEWSYCPQCGKKGWTC